MTDSAENTPVVNPPSILGSNPPPQSLIVSFGMGASEYDLPPHIIVTRPDFLNIMGYTRVETTAWTFHICSARWPARPISDQSISIRVTPDTEIEIRAGGAASYSSGIYWSGEGWTPFGIVTAPPTRPIERYGCDWYYTDKHYRREFRLW